MQALHISVANVAVIISAGAGIFTCFWLLRHSLGVSEITVADPGLLKKHSTQKSYTTSHHIYRSIRTFYHAHPHAAKLPIKPVPLPLLVFIHGLGGCVAQFNPLLAGLVNTAPCLAIDLPGCGMSPFIDKSPAAYTSEALAELLAEVIQQHRDAANDQKVVLIGHSMGCSLAALLASSNSPVQAIVPYVAGLVAICPRAEPPTAKQMSQVKLLRYLPITLFDLFRAYDRRGGTESVSVLRYVGREADAEAKKLQLVFNQRSRSPVFINMLLGIGGLAGKQIWSGLRVPTFCIAGEDDTVCPPENVEVIAHWLKDYTSDELHEEDKDSPLPLAAGEVPLADNETYKDQPVDGTRNPVKTAQGDHPSRRPGGPPEPTATPLPALKTTVLPKPASHGLLYTASTVRILSGLVHSFIATHVDHRLSLGWQLQHLTTEGKWDVKNLEKWKKVQPVSEPIAGIFRAMKTLREVDEQHTPKVFVQQWGSKHLGDYGVRMVVDISHDSPVYDPKGLEEGGIEYYKCPTVSKLPPTEEEVHAFIALVDHLREQLAAEADSADRVIAVHCHYGFNRTGFFLTSYLVEKEGYKLQDALDLFASKRAGGIRHEHFLDELFVRYSRIGSVPDTPA